MPGAKQVPYDLRERTFQFSVRIVKWIRTLSRDLGTQIAAKQLVESATSIGANVEEADGATQQRIEFTNGQSRAKKHAKHDIGSASFALPVLIRQKVRRWIKNAPNW